jgi:hypothetical protein
MRKIGEISDEYIANRNLTLVKKPMDQILAPYVELRSEMNLLLSGAADEAMIMGRTRRLLEVMITDYYIDKYSLKPPYKNDLKPLYNIIEELRKKEKISQTLATLCHKIRLMGNRALHYNPDNLGAKKFPSFSESEVASAIFHCAEITERLLKDEFSVYLKSLPETFQSMFDCFITELVASKN